MNKFKTLMRNINYLTKNSLWEQNEQNIVYYTKKIIDDISYEYNLGYEGQEKLTILSPRDSLIEIIRSQKSFVRTGDGEINFIKGLDQPFQKYDEELAQRLRYLLGGKNKNVYVGINGTYFNPNLISGRSDYVRRWAYEFRQFYYENCNNNILYLDATINTLVGYDINTQEIKERISLWKALFHNRNLKVISGEGIIQEYKYNIFENAKSVEYIGAPRINAWEERDKIKEDIYRKVCKDNDVIVFVLGMAGKALIPEFADQGYLCWDIGHLCKGYDSYMRGEVWDKEKAQSFYAPD